MKRPLGSVTLAATVLVLTSGSARAVEPAPDASFSFEFFRNEILVDVRVNGHGPYLAMIDTGTDPSAIDIDLARELGSRLGTGGEIDGGGTSSETAFETTLDSVEVGPIRASHVVALAGESVSKIAGKLGRPIRAVLGKSLLNGRVLQIDYPRHVMRFLSRSVASPVAVENRRAVLHFRYGDDVELDGVLVDDKPVRAILDTGSNGWLKITPEATRRLGLEGEAKTGKESESTGYRGTYSSREGRVRSLTLGAIRRDNVEATFWLPATGHDGKSWDVNVGNAFLKDFVLTLDTQKGLLILEGPAR